MNVNPERKNLSYSLLLAGSLLLFLICYFIYMIPSLYVDHLMDDNLNSVRIQHRTYVETGSYETIRVKNPTACFSVRIPDQGNSLFLSGKAFSVQITLTDPAMQEKFHQYQAFFANMQSDIPSLEEGSTAEADRFFREWETLFENAMSGSSFSDSIRLPVEITFLETQDLDTEYKNEYYRYHPISEKLIILEAGVEDESNSYTNYMAIEKTDDALIVTLLPVVTPDIREIRPVVLKSLPVLAAVILLLVLLFSLIYSRGIVAPAQRLIAQSYQELEQKNEALEAENKRQEIFLRASSHQLKTPISAALLLVDGMIGKVGKYRDIPFYLPKVKEHLLSMRKMTEDILALNRLKNQLQIQPLNLDALLDSRFLTCQAIISDKHLSVIRKPGSGGLVSTDERAAALILDNLLSNAVTCTPAGGKIEIRTSPGVIQIQNYGIRIPEDLLPHIFEPFVSGKHNSQSHGLGLYIASYYAPMANISLSVTNEGESVLATVSFSR